QAGCDRQGPLDRRRALDDGPGRVMDLPAVVSLDNPIRDDGRLGRNQHLNSRNAALSLIWHCTPPAPGATYPPDRTPVRTRAGERVASASTVALGRVTPCYQASTGRRARRFPVRRHGDCTACATREGVAGRAGRGTQRGALGGSARWLARRVFATLVDRTGPRALS